MQKYIDINSDVGESFGEYKIGNDEEVFKHITSANVACGFHAGDPSVMRYSVLLAKGKGVVVGAHPGLPDLLGFGRRMMDLTPKEVADYTTYQIGSLQAFAKAEGVDFGHIKLHGQLDPLVAKDKKRAEALVKAILKIDEKLILIRKPGSELDEIAKRLGLRLGPELAIDRARHSDGEVVSRRDPNAVITDPLEVADRAERILREGKMKSVENHDITMAPVSSFCVHGDNPNVLEILKALRERLNKIGLEVRPLKEFLK